MPKIVKRFLQDLTLLDLVEWVKTVTGVETADVIYSPYTETVVLKLSACDKFKLYEKKVVFRLTATLEEVDTELKVLRSKWLHSRAEKLDIL